MPMHTTLAAAVLVGLLAAVADVVHRRPDDVAVLLSSQGILSEPEVEAAAAAAAGAAPDVLPASYSIISMTYRRTDNLIKITRQYRSLKGLDKIFIVWNNVGEAPPPLSEFDVPDAAAMAVPVIIIESEVNSLNNRFRIPDGLETEAVLIYDDDLVLNNPEVEVAFKVWQHHQDQIVGFVPRAHRTLENGTRAYICGLDDELRYSMVITRTMFLHRRYLDMYTNAMPGHIRDYVNENRCDDIAMNFLVANATHLPPVYVKGTVQTLFSQIQNAYKGQHNVVTNWGQRRHNCLNHLEAVYGHFPLQFSRVRASKSVFENVCG